MGILFIINMLFLITNIILIKKTSKNEPLILWIFISFIATLLLNALIVFVLSTLNIESTLLIRNLLLLPINFIGLFLIIKNKKIQKYSISINEIITIIFIFIFVGVLSFYRYGKKFNPVFETTDPATHYNMAVKFEQSGYLLENEKSFQPDLYGNSKTSTLFLGYVSVGTGFQIIDTLKNSENAKLVCFMLFNIFILLSSGVGLYYLMDITQKKKNIIFLIIIESLYLFGYPFNDLIFGFHYLGLGIMTIIFSFIIFQYLFKKDISKRLFIPLFIIFSISIFPSYYMFAPIAYGGYGFYYLYNSLILKQEKIGNTIKDIFLYLVIPFSLGLIYYFIRNKFVSDDSSINPFLMEGYIYRNLVSNFLILLIAIFIAIIECIKKKKIDVTAFSLFVGIIFTLILLYLIYNGKIGSYYYYKLYYILWPLCFIIIGKYICQNTFNNELAIKTIICFSASLMILQYYNIDEKWYYKNPLLNNGLFVSSLDNIYWFNNIKCQKNENYYIYDRRVINEMAIIGQKYSNGSMNSQTYYYGNLLEKLWFYNFSRLNPNGEDQTLGAFYYELKPIDEIVNNKNIHYIVCKNDECSNYYNSNFEKDFMGIEFQVLKRK